MLEAFKIHNAIMQDLLTTGFKPNPVQRVFPHEQWSVGMDYGMSVNKTRPLAGYDPKQIMDAPDEESRLALMQKLGVVNAIPPLPHSPCLKNIKTGVVLPWNELLAAQRDLVVCCDENGNTDEAVWGPKVVTGGPTNEELAIMARQRIMMRQEMCRTEYEHAMPEPKLQTGPSEYEKRGVISFDKLTALRESLHDGE